MFLQKKPFRWFTFCEDNENSVIYPFQDGVKSKNLCEYSISKTV